MRVAVGLLITVFVASPLTALAPARAKHAMVVAEEPIAADVGVPGTVRGLGIAHRKFGTKSWRSELQPAISLASRGVILSYGEARSLRTSADELGRDPESRRIFLKGGAVYEGGDRFLQPELAR